MNDEQFKKMDDQWMKATKELREKKVSDGILKGFSASVERRIAGETPKTRPVRVPAWAPVMAVLVLASLVVLRTPGLTPPPAAPAQAVDYAQLPETNDLDEEIAALKAVGAWSEADEALLGASEEAEIEDLEFSARWDSGYSTLA